MCTMNWHNDINDVPNQFVSLTCATRKERQCRKPLLLLGNQWNKSKLLRDFHHHKQQQQRRWCFATGDGNRSLIKAALVQITRELLNINTKWRYYTYWDSSFPALSRSSAKFSDHQFIFAMRTIVSIWFTCNNGKESLIIQLFPIHYPSMVNCVFGVYTLPAPCQHSLDAGPKNLCQLYVHYSRLRLRNAWRMHNLTMLGLVSFEARAFEFRF